MYILYGWNNIKASQMRGHPVCRTPCNTKGTPYRYAFLFIICSLFYCLFIITEQLSLPPVGMFSAT